MKIRNKTQYLANRERVWEAYVRQINSTDGNNVTRMARALDSLDINFGELHHHLTSAYIRFNGMEDEPHESIDLWWVEDVMEEVSNLGADMFFAAALVPAAQRTKPT